MVHDDTHRGNGKKTPKLNPQRVRGALMMRGLTFQDIASQHGVSRQMVWKIARGLRPARGGKSAAIRSALDAASRMEHAA